MGVFNERGFRQLQDGKFECVCGRLSHRTRSVGICLAGGRHKCPLDPKRIFNMRVLIISEPAVGFESSESAPDTVHDLHGVEGFSYRVKTIVDLYVKASCSEEYIVCRVVRFTTVSDLKAQLETLATTYAYYETIFIFSGHGNAEGQLVINYVDSDLDDNEMAADGIELISLIMRHYRPPAPVVRQRIPLIYLAFCHSDQCSRYLSLLDLPGLWNTVLVTAIDTLPALELFSQCGMWLVRSLRSYSIPACVSTFLLHFNMMPSLPRHHIYMWRPTEANPDKLELKQITERLFGYKPATPLLTEDARSCVPLSMCDGVTVIEKETYLRFICFSDGMPNQ